MKFFFSKQPTERREPIKSDFVDMNALAKTIACLLSTVIESNESKRRYHDKYSCITPPQVSIEHYLLHLMHYLTQEKSEYIIMLIYLNTYFEKNKEKYINAFNVHRLLAYCIVLAHKSRVDTPFSNKYMSSVVGIPLKEFNQIEPEFYKELNYKLFISTQEYEACLQEVLSYQHS